MKTLHVIRTLDPAYGGPLEGMCLMVREIARRGHPVHVLTLDNAKPEWRERLQVPVTVLNARCSGYGFTLGLVSWLRRHAAEYDAVIVNGVWHYQSLGCWLALRNSGVPYFLYTHGALNPWFARAYPAKHWKKLLYWKAVEQRVVRDARAVLFTSEEERELAAHSFVPFRCEQEVVSYCAQGDNSQINHFNSGKFILFLGRLHEVKGCDLLIRAFARVAGREPALKLILAGPDCGMGEQLRSLTKSLRMEDRVTLVGPQYGEQKWELLRGAELLAAPSLCECFGVSIAEALSCGVPVAITNQVNIWREIEAAKAGLVSDTTVEDYSRILLQWMESDEGQRRAMRANARACYGENYRPERAVSILFQTLRKRGVYSGLSNGRLITSCAKPSSLA